MTKQKEEMIFIRGKWEIARVETNTSNGLQQWVRRDSSFICFVGKEEGRVPMPPKPGK